jgi:putative acetyltransferase
MAASLPAIVDATGPAQFEAARELFREYAEALGISLCFQGFDKELEVLDTMYAPPGGALLLLESAGVFDGCVGLRTLGDQCEMKRLYVRPQLRGAGWGRKLAEAAVARARSIGYSRLYLDTLPEMVAARALYADMGFRETPPYYRNPVEGVTYMVKDLRP